MRHAGFELLLAGWYGTREYGLGGDVSGSKLQWLLQTTYVVLNSI